MPQLAPFTHTPRETDGYNGEVGSLMPSVEAKQTRPPGLELVERPCCLCANGSGRAAGIGEDFEYRTSDDIYTARFCDRCGLVYLSPRPALSELDRIYPSTYHAYQFTEEEFGFVHRVRCKLEARRLMSYCRDLPATARILDVGCGDGFHLKLLASAGPSTWTLEGVDASERAVNAARRCGLMVHHGTVESVPLQPESYDLALLIATIEHVDDPVRVLTAVARLLRPGGRVMVVTDSTGTLDFRIFGKRHWGGYHFPRHFNLFNRRSLSLLAGHAGLEVDRLTTSLSPVNWVYSIRNSLVDGGAPSWMVEQFSLKAPLALAVFTLVDAIFCLFGRGALLRLVARKPQ